METTSNKTKITVAATVNAPVAKVWEIYTNPEHIVNWNNASPDWHTPKATNDLRVDGRFVYTMAAKDGSVSFDFGGTYTLVENKKQFNYTMDDERTAEVTFAETNGATYVTVIFEAETENTVELQEMGWQAILNNFKIYTESN